MRRCGPGARLMLLTDGLFAHDGSVAPLAKYLEILRRMPSFWSTMRTAPE